MLRRLELKNFRNYEHLVVDFDPQGRTLVIGENGRGKSGLADAIQWMLTGRCRGVDGKGAGQKDLIRTGADDMMVTGVWDKLGAVTRSISLAGSSTASMPTDVILAKLGVTQGMLESVLSGRAFFLSHHADAKDLLMRLLNVRIPKDQLPGVDLPDTVADVDLGYLEQLFRSAFDNRAAIKKSLAAAFVPEEPKVISIDLGGKNLADVQRKLAKDQNDLLKAVRDLARSEQNLADLKAKLAAGDRLIAGRPALDGSRATHQDMLAKHEAELATAQAALVVAQAEAVDAPGSLDIQLREAASLIDKIERHTQATAAPAAKGGKKYAKNLVVGQAHACVLSADIPCLTAISEFQGQVERLKANQKTLEGRIRAGNERAGKVAAANQAVKESERHVVYHQTQIGDIDAKIAAADAAAGSVADMKLGIEAVEAAVAVGQKNISDWRAEVEQQQQQLAELATYEQARQTYQAAVERRGKLEDQVKQAEALVDLLGPKGIRLTYLDQALGDFQLAINAALDLFGFSLSINVEPWRVEVRRAADSVVRFDMLSDGEKLWTGLAFQIALAAMSGLDFCVLDAAETVVGANRAVLTELIMGAPVQQVLVAMAKADDEPAPDIDGLQVLRVGQAGQLVGV